jgi:sulfate transport system ATP-binding protein
LAVEPKVLLLDEPFGALDAKVRKELRRWLRRLHDELHVTSIFVTHDQEEALEVADRVVVMNHGKIEQAGTPQEVYDHPATPFVFSFLGSVNLFHGRVHEDELRVGEHGVSLDAHTLATGDAAIAYARPHELLVSREGEGLPAQVLRVLTIGPATRLELSLASGEVIEAEVSRERLREQGFQANDRVRVQPINVRVFPAEEARR